MQSAKETASNVAASAKAGMEKTKATMQEKGERMTTRDPLQKDLATEKKDERIYQAEQEKQAARQQHALDRETATAGGGGMMGHGFGIGDTAGTHGGITGTETRGTTTGERGMRAGLRSDYPQGITEDPSDDPNVAGGAGTGNGAGATF